MINYIKNLKITGNLNIMNSFNNLNTIGKQQKLNSEEEISGIYFNFIPIFYIITYYII